tara:strand:+ start:96 stop:656 length:561 start_codon:yes stop_codon:yes gene_type:complete
MFFEFLGWLAVSIFFICHIYVSVFNDLNRKAFFALNTLAAFLMIISSWAISSWVIVIYNIFWIIISSISFINKSKLKSLITVKHLKLLISLILILAFATLMHDMMISINILGYGSIAIMLNTYLLYSTKQLERVDYLKYDLVAMFIILPQLFIDKNYPALTSESIFIFITAFGLIKYYKWYKKELA